MRDTKERMWRDFNDAGTGSHLKNLVKSGTSGDVRLTTYIPPVGATIYLTNDIQDSGSYPGNMEILTAGYYLVTRTTRALCSCAAGGGGFSVMVSRYNSSHSPLEDARGSMSTYYNLGGWSGMELGATATAVFKCNAGDLITYSEWDYNLTSFSFLYDTLTVLKVG